MAASLKLAERSRSTDPPPFSEDAEHAVLAAVLMEPGALRLVRPLLKAEDFFCSPNRRMFAAQLTLADRGVAIDPITLAEELDRCGELEACGGKSYIGYLIDAAPTAVNIEYHARIIVERAQRRALQAFGETMSRAALDGTIDVPSIARTQRDTIDRFLSIVESGALPSAVRASDAPASTPLAWAIEELWPAGEIGLIVGDGGSFKSTAAIHMAGAIAGGYTVFGRFATLQAPTLIVSAEDSADVVFMRLRAFVSGQGWNAKTLDNVHVVANPEATLADPRWQSHISREALRVGAGFIVLDPLAELIGGDENSNSDIRPVVKYLRQLARDASAGVGVVHHAGKAGQDKRQLDRIRGASALASAARTILFFEYQPDGVMVTHLKSSRAQKLEPFVLTRWIDSEPDNRAEWISARLSFETARAAKLNRGEEFVIAQVTASPRMLTSGNLRTIGQSIGLSGQDVSNALVTLQASNRIDFEATTRGGKLWFATLPGRVDTPTLPTLPMTLPGRVSEAFSDPAPPLRGAGWVASGCDEGRVR